MTFDVKRTKGKPVPKLTADIGRRHERPEQTSHCLARDPEKERRKGDGGWS